MIETDPTDYLDQVVTLIGTAHDAAGGAVILLADGTPVYITGLRSWARNWDRKRIAATGTLSQRKLAPDPSVTTKGEHNPGKYGDDLVLECASWEEAQ